MWGAIASAVLPSLAAGFAGRVFGSNKPQRTVSTSEVDYKKLVEDAQAAGFNPLTALQYGAPTTSTTTTPPALSSGQFIAEAVGRGVETYFNRDQLARDEEAEQIRLDLMREELTAMRSENSIPPSQRWGAAIPTYTGPGPGYTGTAPSSYRAPDLATGPNGYPNLPDSVLVNRTDGLTGGNPDAPAEAEIDLWSWAREGTLAPNLWEIWQRNVMPGERREIAAARRERTNRWISGINDWLFGAPAPEPMSDEEYDRLFPPLDAPPVRQDRAANPLRLTVE